MHRSRWRALALAVGATLSAVGIHLYFEALSSSGLRPVPALAAVPWLLAAVGAIAAVGSAVTIRRQLRRRRTKLLSGVLHGMLVVGGLSGTLASDPEFPFGSRTVESMSLPDGRGRAHLVRGGLFCDQTVWVSQPWSLVARRDSRLGVYACEQELALTWDTERSRVGVVRPDGRPVTSAHDWASGLARVFAWH